MKRAFLAFVAASGLATGVFAQTVQVQQLPVAQSPLPANAAFWCATPLATIWHTYQCQMSEIASYLTGGANTWSGANTFSNASLTGGSIGPSVNVVLGAASGASLALGGATIGSNILAVAGAVSVTGNISTTGAEVRKGTPPVLTGTCTTSAQVGGNTAGKFAATCTAQTVIVTFATTAPNGWVCIARDMTTPADALNQTAYSTTSCTLTGTTVASDSVVFEATAF